MTDQMREEAFDRQIRDFLAWQAAKTAGAPSAIEMAETIGAGLGTRAVGLRLAPLVVWVVLVGLLAIALVGAVVIGAGLLQVSIAEPTPRPSPSAVVSAPPSQLIVASGTTSTTIGQVSWTSVRGNSTSLPQEDIFEIRDGFGAIEQDPNLQSSRFWVSSDGVQWAVAPMPVPASGHVQHWVTSAGHWIWSVADFRLWQSSDFVTWTEVAVNGLRPPDVDGVDWSVWPNPAPVTAGATTVLPWFASGRLALDRLLRFQLEPGEQWELAFISDPPLPLGTAREVFRTRHPQTSGRSGADPSRVRVGSIRVTVDGSSVTITDAERDIILARIDSDVVGIPALTLADKINSEGAIGQMLGGGAVISNGIAHAFTPPADFQDLFVAQGRIVGITYAEGPASSRFVWASTNGLDWESLRPPAVPLAGSEIAHFDLVLRRPGGVPGEPLVAPVLIDEDGGGQRKELWSSADGLTWVNDGLVYRFDGTGTEGLVPFFAPSGSFLATGDDFRLHVSREGADWTTVNGFEVVGSDPNQPGWGTSVSVTHQATFIADVLDNGDRVLYIVRVESGGS